jgi:molybdate transport system ATP-binding protein
MNTLINVNKAVPRLPEFQFDTAIDWSLSTGEHWAIIGPNGSGKTLFSNIITGKVPLKNGSITYHFTGENPVYEQIKCATFQDVYSLTDYKNRYYQQRWNSTEEESPTVGDILKKSSDAATLGEFVSFFEIEDLLDKRLILLSSGELRKFLIIRILLLKPKVLVLDNPYIGLDAPSRDLLNSLLDEIVRRSDLQLILILSNPDDIPPVITHILPLKNKKLLPVSAKMDFLDKTALIQELFPTFSSEHTRLLLQEVQKEDIHPFLQKHYYNALKMNDIHIHYGKRTILKNLNWIVRRGERWVLLGPNGAGKSTLLSLVCADNPQAYANTFYLFDKKRGSGESIWYIKKRIGYVSPEVHLYFQSNQNGAQIVGSGFFDSIGLYRKCTPEQLGIARKWMAVFGIEHLSERPFMHMSFGEQRLVILARAFVKNPELLILDEPLHGLDKSNKKKVKQIIEQYCEDNNKTLIYVTHYLNEIPNSVTNQLQLEMSKNI